MKCIISCEHASNRVPPRFAHIFTGQGKVLTSHQAYDYGAAKLARSLAGQIHAPVYLGAISRLLIDLNRSPSNRKSLFTHYSRMLPQNERELLLQKYYLPYREKVENAVGEIIGKGKPVVHVSIHSFAPVKRGKTRKADIGLLYDPARKAEKDICAFMVQLLKKEVVSLRVRRNYPYQGKTDGFTSYLRRKYAAKFYAGIEIEINQDFLLQNDNNTKKVKYLLEKGISNMLQADTFSQLVNNKGQLVKSYVCR